MGELGIPVHPPPIFPGNQVPQQNQTATIRTQWPKPHSPKEVPLAQHQSIPTIHNAQMPKPPNLRPLAQAKAQTTNQYAPRDQPYTEIRQNQPRPIACARTINPQAVIPRKQQAVQTNTRSSQTICPSNRKTDERKLSAPPNISPD